MKNLRNQTSAQIEKTRKGNPKFAQAVDKLLIEAKAFKQGAEALAVGQKSPNFTLPNANGNKLELKALLGKGPVVITFYRGSWCPYCNIQLKALGQRLTEIHALGTELVAISPQLPDESLSIIEKQELTFPVLSDQDAKVAASYGVAWQVPKLLLDHMKNDRGLDLERINNGNRRILPIPATFIINSDGTIVWRFIDIDYRNRCEPEEIIQQLKRLAS